MFAVSPDMHMIQPIMMEFLSGICLMTGNARAGNSRKISLTKLSFRRSYG